MCVLVIARSMSAVLIAHCLMLYSPTRMEYPSVSVLIWDPVRLNMPQLRDTGNILAVARIRKGSHNNFALRLQVRISN